MLFGFCLGFLDSFVNICMGFDAGILIRISVRDFVQFKWVSLGFHSGFHLGFL